MLFSKRRFFKKNNSGNGDNPIKTVVAIFTLLISVNLFIWSCDYAQPLPIEYGQYDVGRKALYMEDHNRIEIFGENPGSSRELMVYLWYPAQIDSSATKGQWLDSNTLSFLINSLSANERLLTSPKTESYPNASILEQDEKYNVILMSHGDGVISFGNYSTAEFLASHGFVVAGISHTYNAQLTVFPDGRVALADPRASSLYSDDDYSEDTIPTFEMWEESMAQSLKISDLLADDMQFVLDELENRNDSEFSGMLNTGNAGVFGHSLGGSGSIETLLRDSRIQAGVDLDGSLFISDPEAGTDKPVMFMLSSTFADFMQDGTADTESQLNSLGWTEEQKQEALLHHFSVKHFAQNSPNSRSYAIENTEHFNFTDMVVIKNLLPSGLKDPSINGGSINPYLSVEIVREYLLDFFNIHLLDQQGTLLDSQEYSEVTREEFQ